MSEPGLRRSTQAGEGALVVQTRLQSAVGRQMAASKREIPHFYVNAEIEMDQATAELRRLAEQAEPGHRITMSAVLVRCLAQTLREYPAFNCVSTDEGFVIVDSVNVGVAIALESGLIAPALLDADRMGVVELAGALDDLVKRSRAGKLRSAEMLGPTFTLSNLGMFGVTAFSAIIPPPQVGILAVGRSIARPVVVDGSIAVREIMTATLASDHRAVDGAQAARFLTALKKRLETFRAED